MDINWKKEKLQKNRQAITFIDFAKAYNSIPQDKLLEIIKEKYDTPTFNIIKQTIKNQTIELPGKHYIKSLMGIP